MLVGKTFVLFFADFVFDGGTSVTKKSVCGCAARCANTIGCSSYFYSKGMKSCMISFTGYKETTGLAPQTGYSYYRMPAAFGRKCVIKADCLFRKSRCKEAICECRVGYSYDWRNERCVKRCTKYGHFFARYQGYGILGYNRRKLSIAQAKKCKRACVKEKRFTCNSAEHHPHRRLCNLSNIRWFDVPKRKREQNQGGWTLYYRHCAM